ncbi:M1 family metallopeptidase [Alteriqipengyuania flavescens]|uniref:M1 family metallopeptidase n=1 Tax=Alteriqipengyuania flavescens TaxID=3053610 RepID=UPI0025B5D155|nr:M1 family metallopeptidase [Alteriqipengyuania flavescens]WJY19564.1 M1 family metallopeptidase [Alteriqipengyuania flavescens]WJY25504.1 M1 family metallopeptidase [Alteriqipengyuania flavescens]
MRHVLLPALLATAALPATVLPAAAQDTPAELQAPPLAERTSASGFALTAAQAATDLPHLDLMLKVDPATRTIDGMADYTVKATAPLQRAEFDLDPRFAITSVTVNGRPGRWTNDGGFLSIDLGRTLRAGQTAKVTIAWNGAPHVARRAPWDGGFVWSETPEGAPWIATAVQMNGCDLFWPCIDHPIKEIGRLDSTIVVPEGLTAAGNGKLVGSSTEDGWTSWNWSTRNPNTYAVALNIGPYELASTEYASRFGNTIPLKFWHLPGHGEDAAELLEEMKSYLDFFEEMIGPYPFADEKVGLAETPHLGMEHQTINAYGNEFKPSPQGYDWLAQHEFSHEWFANQLTNTAPNHMWLHEGLGTYMQPLFLQWRDGEAAYQAALVTQRQGLLNRSPVVPAAPITSAHYLDEEAGWGRDIYGKGSEMAHTLRQLIGDEAFFTTIRRIVYGRPDPRPGNFVPQFADTDDFQRIAEEESGRDLDWFFDAYLREAALPVLTATRNGGTLELAWERESGEPFPMPVEVRFDGRLETVPMTGGTGSISLGSDSMHYVLDPMNKVLRFSPAIDEWQTWMMQQRGMRRGG